MIGACSYKGWEGQKGEARVGLVEGRAGEGVERLVRMWGRLLRYLSKWGQEVIGVLTYVARGG